MTRHLFRPEHLPHPRIAEHVAGFVEYALEAAHLHPVPAWHEPPARMIPPAEDWPDWHWDRDGGEW